MFNWFSGKGRPKRNPRDRRLKLEVLEQRRFLAIVWANEFDAPNSQFDPNFSVYGSANEPLARAIVNRAISDWERVIESFNYAEDNDADPNNDLNDTFALTVIAQNTGAARGYAGNFTETGDGKPVSATILLSSNGGGAGWFFDPTPLDDAEFTGLINGHAASFVDVDAEQENRVYDFYQTVLHEIGHALGFAPTSVFPGYSRWDASIDANGMLLDTNGQPLAQLAPGGGHLHPSVYPDYLMHPDVAVGSPKQTYRLFISDLEATILSEVYGYDVNLPSTFDTAHVTLDGETGTLLVQGLPGAVNEDIELNLLGVDIEVLVGDTREVVPAAAVAKIVIAKNRGDYDISVDGAIAQSWQEVDYVVSSNEDAVDGGAIGDGLVDVDATVAGNQATLRTAA